MRHHTRRHTDTDTLRHRHTDTRWDAKWEYYPWVCVFWRKAAKVNQKSQKSTASFKSPLQKQKKLTKFHHHPNQTGLVRFIMGLTPLQQCIHKNRSPAECLGLRVSIVGICDTPLVVMLTHPPTCHPILPSQPKKSNLDI